MSKEDFSPRKLLSKETFFQGDSYINYCPRNYLPREGVEILGVFQKRDRSWGGALFHNWSV